jgi:hypothetical protein
MCNMSVMALGDGGIAPYAPTHAVTKVLDAFRASLPADGPITQNTLTRLGVPTTIQPRTLQALRILDLVDEEGRPTQDFVAFKHAPHDKYKGVLAEMLRRAYAPVFTIVGADPKAKTRLQITDAFLTYTPSTLRARMVSLFMGLCEYVGLLDKSSTRTPAKSTQAPKPAKSTGQTGTRNGRTQNQQTNPLPPVVDDESKTRYLSLLLAKAEAQETPDPELLDRIERALGITPKAEASTS